MAIAAQISVRATAPLRGRDGWSARRAATDRARRTAPRPAPRACASRPTTRQSGWCLHRRIEPEPGEDARRPRRCGAGADRRRAAPRSRRCAAARDHRRARSSSRLRSRSAASTVSSALAAPPGASCARKPMRQPRGRKMSPRSGKQAPADQIEQRRLAGAVAPDQADLAALGDLRVGLVEQCPPMAPADAIDEAGNRQHRGVVSRPAPATRRAGDCP